MPQEYKRRPDEGCWGHGENKFRTSLERTLSFRREDVSIISISSLREPVHELSKSLVKS